MKSLRSWIGREFCLKLGLAAASFVVLAGCSRFTEMTSHIPVVALRMDSRYINGTEYQKSLMLYEKGLLLEARSKARGVNRKDPEYRDARRLIASINSILIKIAREHRELGESYDNAGIYEKAVAEYTKSLKYDPSNSRISDRLAELNVAIRDGSQPVRMGGYAVVKAASAGKPAKKSVKKNEKPPEPGPEHKADLHYTKGKIYLEAKAYAKASREFDLALSFVPTYMNARELRDLSETEKKKAIEAHLRKGISYFQEEEMELAIKEWETVLSYDPDNEDARDYKYRAEIILERLRSIRRQQAGSLGKPL